jgi:hypothetical protein
VLFRSAEGSWPPVSVALLAPEAASDVTLPPETIELEEDGWF